MALTKKGRCCSWSSHSWWQLRSSSSPILTARARESFAWPLKTSSAFRSHCTHTKDDSPLSAHRQRSGLRAKDPPHQFPECGEDASLCFLRAKLLVFSEQLLYLLAQVIHFQNALRQIALPRRTVSSAVSVPRLSCGARASCYAVPAPLWSSGQRERWRPSPSAPAERPQDPSVLPELPSLPACSASWRRQPSVQERDGVWGPQLLRMISL